MRFFSFTTGAASVMVSLNEPTGKQCNVAWASIDVRGEIGNKMVLKLGHHLTLLLMPAACLNSYS